MEFEAVGWFAILMSLLTILLINCGRRRRAAEPNVRQVENPNEGRNAAKDETAKDPTNDKATTDGERNYEKEENKTQTLDEEKQSKSLSQSVQTACKPETIDAQPEEPNDNEETYVQKTPSQRQREIREDYPSMSKILSDYKTEKDGPVN